MLAGLPSIPGVSYVIAQHMSPHHSSMLASLLAPRTALRVVDLTDNTVPEPDTIYITPPNHDVVFHDGQFHLEPPSRTPGPKPSVDRLFLSLADSLGERAVGVILSGTGSDGSAGLRAIKAAGGLTLVQEPRTAKYDGMPRAAIFTGKVDLITTTEEMGPALAQVLGQGSDLPVAKRWERHETDLDRIYRLVHHRTGFRLSDYKPATVKRRIARRMGLVGSPDTTTYAEVLEKDDQEARRLVEATSVSVTAFFRDAKAFEALRTALRDALSRDSTDGVFRCWVPGCATGEEAYTIAFLLEDALEELGNRNKQYLIFGSDIDEEALAVARAGSYPAPLFATVPEELTERFTVLESDRRRVSKRIRNRVVFARQNVIEDPPFSRMHLVSCRNLLIYLVPEVQQRVLDTLHYSLHESGLLFLGKSESIAPEAGQFRALNHAARLFRQVPGALRMSRTPGTIQPARSPAASAPRARKPESQLADVVTKRLLEQFSPPSIVLDDRDRVVFVSGETSLFLKYPSGPVDLLVYDLVEPGIRADLRAMVYRCRRHGEALTGQPRPYTLGDTVAYHSTRVAPLQPDGSPFVLVSFVPSDAPLAPRVPTPLDTESLVIQELERELGEARAHLGVVVEELETSNEELQAINEELQSTNEELQSTNEEFQTSNEELQSSNEELITVNEELRNKTEALEILSTELHNIKESLGFPLLVIDNELRVTRANAAAQTLVKNQSLRPGQSLHTLAWAFPVPGIEERVVDVIEAGTPHTMVLHLSGDRFVRLSVVPYLHDLEEQEGAVLLFQDMTAHMRAERDRRASDERFQAFIDHSPTAVWTRNRTGGLTYANEAYRKLMRDREAYGPPLDWDVYATAVLDRLLRATASTSQMLEEDITVRGPDGSTTWWRQHLFILWDGGPEPKLGCIAFDVTEAKRSQELLAEQKERLRLALDAASAGVFSWQTSSDTIEASAEALQVLGLPAAGVPPSWATLWSGLPRDTQDKLRTELQAAAASGRPFEFSRVLDDHSKGLRHVTIRGQPSAKHSDQFIGIVLDSTASHAADEARRAEQAARAAASAKDAFLATMSHELRTPLNAILGYAQLLESTSLAPGGRRDLERLQSAATSMLHLVNDILDLSKLEADALTIRERPFELKSVVDSVRQVARPLVQAKGLLFSSPPIPPTLQVPLLGDADRLTQILVNLVSNAIKFTPEGTVRLAVEPVPPRTDGAQTLRFTVSDTGVGIAPEHLETIFERFTQLDPGDRRAQQGTGLGLAIVRKLVNRMDGTLSVESVQGQGSTFSVTLSLPVAPMETRPSPPPAAARGLDLSGLHLLIVDDNDLNRDVLARLLQRVGARTTTTGSGAEAIAYLRALMREGPVVDAVLMDVQMPDMTGMEATRVLREIPGLEALPVIGASAGVTPNDRERALNGGMDAYATKPPHMPTLVELIRSVVSQTSAPADWRPVDGVDMEAARELLLDDWTLFRSSLKILVQQLDGLEPMQLDLSDESAPRALHRLAGAASALAASGLEAAARSAMQAIADGDGDALSRAAQALEQEMDRLRRAVTAL
jgi:signal transduction histidine kinase/chemotaxis methyl-accepting protein methylase/chemotaxis response regulator CheB